MKFDTRAIATMSMMLSMIFVCSLLERLLPPLPFQMRFGLANVVTMYALFFMGVRSALMLTLAKSVFVLLTRGGIASLLSLSGGLLSLGVLAAAAFAFPNASYLVLSICGALAHNVAQIAVASWLSATNLFPFYLPILLAAAIAAGALTGTLLRVVMPIFRRGELRGMSSQRV